jgi:hypothetical protein
MGKQTGMSVYKHDVTAAQKSWAYISALTGIRDCDSSVRPVQDLGHKQSPCCF